VVVIFTDYKWKKIGILGGMGPEATAQLYFRIIKLFQRRYGAKYDADFPEIIILNLPIPDVVESPQQKVKCKLIYGLKKLASAKVDFIAIPCNTINCYMPDFRNEVSVPIINLLRETVSEVQRLKLKRIGLLATEMSIRKKIYDKILGGIKMITPNLKQQKAVTQIILRVMAGEKRNSDKKMLQEIILYLRRKGAEKIILGCTELPLLVKNNKDTLSTIEILAKAVVTKSIVGGLENEN
jgi:aspartate racemase